MIVVLLTLVALVASLGARGDLRMTAGMFAGMLPFPALLTIRELRFLTDRGIDDGFLRVRLLVGAFLLAPALSVSVAVLLLVSNVRPGPKQEGEVGHVTAATIAGAVVIIQYALARRTASRLAPAPPIALTERDLPPKHPPAPPVPFRWP